jgi:hypothetical protein
VRRHGAQDGDAGTRSSCTRHSAQERRAF